MPEIENEIIQIKILLEKIEGIIDSRLTGEKDPEEAFSFDSGIYFLTNSSYLV